MEGGMTKNIQMNIHLGRLRLRRILWIYHVRNVKTAAGMDANVPPAAPSFLHVFMLDFLVRQPIEKLHTPNTAPHPSVIIVQKTMVRIHSWSIVLRQLAPDVLGTRKFLEGLGWIGVMGVGVLMKVLVSPTNVSSSASEREDSGG
jgi:hypothetical protein